MIHRTTLCSKIKMYTTSYPSMTKHRILIIIWYFYHKNIHFYYLVTYQYIWCKIDTITIFFSLYQKLYALFKASPNLKANSSLVSSFNLYTFLSLHLSWDQQKIEPTRAIAEEKGTWMVWESTSHPYYYCYHCYYRDGRVGSFA